MHRIARLNGILSGKRWTHLVCAFLALPWTVIWTSSMTQTDDHYPICPSIGNLLCEGSYIPDFKNYTITCHKGEDGCQDFVDALNEAHERRTKIPPGLSRNKYGDLVPSNITKEKADLYWKDSKKVFIPDYESTRKTCAESVGCHFTGTECECGEDSKKAEWEGSVEVDSITADYWSHPSKMITNKEACGQDDCGQDPK